jgi:hypothetical protein
MSRKPVVLLLAIALAAAGCGGGNTAAVPQGPGPDPGPVQRAYDAYAACGGCQSAYPTLFSSGADLITEAQNTGDTSGGCTSAIDDLKNAGANWSYNADANSGNPITDAHALSDAAGAIAASCHETSEMVAAAAAVQVRAEKVRKAAEALHAKVSRVYRSTVRCHGCTSAAKALLAITHDNKTSPGACHAARRALIHGINLHGRSIRVRDQHGTGAAMTTTFRIVNHKLVAVTKVLSARTVVLRAARSVVASCA